MSKPSIVIITGDSGCGKTTVCRGVAAAARQQGWDAAGIVTPTGPSGRDSAGRDVEDVRSGRRRPLAQPAALVGSTDGPATNKWRFHTQGLAWGLEVLRGALPCDLLIIDELGPLELLRHQGWAPALDLLRAGGCRLALVVVRPELLAVFQEQVTGPAILVLRVTPANRNAVPGQVIALLGDRP